MSRPTLSERVRGAGRGRRFGPQAPLLGAMLALGAAHCTFPDYDLERGSLGGAGGGSGGGATPNGAVAGNGGSAGTGTNPTDGGAPVSEAGAAGAGGEAAVPFECGGEQWPIVECPGDCL